MTTLIEKAFDEFVIECVADSTSAIAKDKAETLYTNEPEVEYTF